MHARWMRVQKWCVALACGGLTPGILQGLGMVSFAQMFTQLLAVWLSALVVFLLGGDVTRYLESLNFAA